MRGHQPIYLKVEKNNHDLLLTCRRSEVSLGATRLASPSDGASSSGKTLDFDSSMRRFDPCRPSHS